MQKLKDVLVFYGPLEHLKVPLNCFINGQIDGLVFSILYLFVKKRKLLMTLTQKVKVSNYRLIQTSQLMTLVQGVG